MFPGPNSTIIRNEAGEPLGWDTHYPGDDEPDYEEQERKWEAAHCYDCGALHHECVCDKICDSCGEPTLDDNGYCEDDDCPSNVSTYFGPFVVPDGA